MKTFLSFLFTGHPIKAVKSIFQSDDRIAFEKFEEEEYRIVALRYKNGSTKSQTLRGVKYALKFAGRFPCEGLEDEFPHVYARDPEKITTTLLNGSSVYLIVSREVILRFGLENNSTNTIKNLEWVHPRFQVAKAYEALDKAIRTDWLKHMARLGETPYTCPHCDDEDMRISVVDFTCYRCDCELDFAYDYPEDLYSAYKSVLELRPLKGKDKRSNKKKVPEAHAVDEFDSDTNPDNQEQYW